MTTIFMVGLSIFSFVQINNLFKSSNLIYHNNQVKETLRDISSSLLEAETNKRGFLLTRDSVMLQQRDKALHSLERAQQELDSLINGNTGQELNASLLHQAIEEKKKGIRATDIEGLAVEIPFNLRTNIDEGVRQMNSVKTLLDEMTRKESSLLEQRTLIYTRLSLIAPFYIIVLFLGALLILSFSYFKLNAELEKSQKLHASLILQDEVREALAEKLILANEELAFQNDEKEKRASELALANEELEFQNKTKEKLAGELIIANQELAFQNEEKEKRASELALANVELEFQNKTKEKLAGELIIANHELAFQNQEKERRAAELVAANKELQLFLNISSHDLQEPLRKIQMAASRIEKSDYLALSEKGRVHFVKMQEAALSMQTLIEDLLTYARTNSEERKFENIDLGIIIDEVLDELKDTIEERNAVIEVTEICEANVIHFQFRQLLHNIISNALKFSIPGKPPHIQISANLKPGHACLNDRLKQDVEYCHIRISDNGIGFEPIYREKIFEVFQRLYGKETYKGTGIGLAIVKRIVENHDGCIIANGELNKGATFDIYIPTIKKPQHG